MSVAGSTPSSAVVELSGIGRRFDGTPPVDAVRDLDLHIAPGEYVTIVGRSGSGKSTLLNVLGLLDRPTSGTYRLDGVDTSMLSERERARLRATLIGFVFQSFHLIAHATALENVMLGGLYTGASARARRERAAASLARVGLQERASFRPDLLSGGERQRVAIARALANSPRLLLADEPTGNLDSSTADEVLALFDELHADGATILMITHDSDVSSRAQRTIRLVDGRAAAA